MAGTTISDIIVPELFNPGIRCPGERSSTYSQHAILRRSAGRR